MFISLIHILFLYKKYLKLKLTKPQSYSFDIPFSLTLSLFHDFWAVLNNNDIKSNFDSLFFQTRVEDREMVKILGKFHIPREYIETAVSIILRVPALFIFEAWYKSDPEAATQNAHQDVALISLASYYSSRPFSPFEHNV